ncbi:MAG: 16S rRNA (uracil(1498)-N(3))-methyltransferase [Bifidobacteriaceae bacterium]|jgi:16S rRNA (uracil1498-N3)-methyltransferase|nr:16S rRNA (uracil(1498)-N(3))-methyltransferase [Bifidobacteriaceae bacterium]MCI1978612.1 16S rRNA (uracil(1498)-N(3))-methyltransferase [Bifidobacteriaceae bacterium]
MTSPLFIAESEAFEGIDTIGKLITLSEKLQRHIVKSLRMGVGDSLDLSDGKGLRCSGELVDADEGLVRITSILREEAPDVRLCLVQGLAKGGRDEMAIEESTEIGVDAVIPWQADRSIVRWSGQKETKAAKKWDAVLTAATEQSRRAWKPELGAKVTSSQLVRLCERVTGEGDVMVVLHQDATDTWGGIERRVVSAAASSVLSQAAPSQTVPSASFSEHSESSVNLVSEESPRPRTIFVVVGPEGGISDREVGDLVAAGARSVVIGRSIMRASTAGPVAIALLSRALGRF